MPSHDLVLGPDRLTLELHGVVAAGALRRRVSVPYAAIRSVTTDPLPERPRLWRMGGYGGLRRRYGTFRQGGRWLFLAVDDPASVVRLALDGDGPERVRFSELVVSDPDPVALADRIREQAGVPAA